MIGLGTNFLEPRMPAAQFIHVVIFCSTVMQGPFLVKHKSCFTPNVPILGTENFQS